MGLGHIFGLGDGRRRVHCRNCGTFAWVDPDARECPECGSADVDRIALL
jgi:Zn finger protein HypA/HybF involved in hydrogenase expression